MDLDVKITRRSDARTAIPATGREHLITVACGLWLTVGLFLDGYAHQNIDGQTESFLTPWHGVFYAGFTAAALWLTAMSRRRSDGAVDWRLSFLPPGYEGARAGLALFALGGIGDAAWHSAFGVERGVDALLSPTHLVLFVGLMLILTAPFRAAVAAPDSAPRPWTVVASVISAAALVGFFLNFAWGLGVAAFARVAYDPVTEVGETQVIAGVASMLVTTVVLFGAARCLLRRGLPPRGAFIVLFGIVALLVSVAFDEDAEGVVAAIFAGVALEVLVRSRWPSAVGRGTVAMSFGGAAVVLWLGYLGLLSVLDGIEWQAEIWVGGIALNVLAAYAIAVLPSPDYQRTPSIEGDRS